MRPIGKLLKTAEIDRAKLKQELLRFLLQFRSTPYKTTRIAPCELLYNQQIHGFLPQLPLKKVINKHRIAMESIKRKKLENKDYYDKKKGTKFSNIGVGDTVICLQWKRNKLTPTFNPEKLTVVVRYGSKVCCRK